MKPAEPMLAVTTDVVCRGELFLISFRMENICFAVSKRHPTDIYPLTFW